MTTITIPKNLIKEKELVVIPRQEYEKLLDKQTKKRGIRVRRFPSFRVPQKHEAFYNKLDKELTEILKECDEGKVSKSFATVEELRHSLEK